MTPNYAEDDDSSSVSMGDDTVFDDDDTDDTDDDTNDTNDDEMSSVSIGDDTVYPNDDDDDYDTDDDEMLIKRKSHTRKCIIDESDDEDEVDDLPTKSDERQDIIPLKYESDDVNDLPTTSDERQDIIPSDYRRGKNIITDKVQKRHWTFSLKNVTVEDICLLVDLFTNMNTTNTNKIRYAVWCKDIQKNGKYDIKGFIILRDSGQAESAVRRMFPVDGDFISSLRPNRIDITSNVKDGKYEEYSKIPSILGKLNDHVSYKSEISF